MQNRRKSPAEIREYLYFKKYKQAYIIIVNTVEVTILRNIHKYSSY